VYNFQSSYPSPARRKATGSSFIDVFHDVSQVAAWLIKALALLCCLVVVRKTIY